MLDITDLKRRIAERRAKTREAVRQRDNPRPLPDPPTTNDDDGGSGEDGCDFSIALRIGAFSSRTDPSAWEILVEVTIHLPASESDQQPTPLRLRFTGDLRQAGEASVNLTEELIDKQVEEKSFDPAWELLVTGLNWHVVDSGKFDAAARFASGVDDRAHLLLKSGVGVLTSPVGGPAATVATTLSGAATLPIDEPLSMASTMLNLFGVAIGLLFGLHPLAIQSFQSLLRNQAKEMMTTAIDHAIERAFPPDPSPGPAPRPTPPTRGPRPGPSDQRKDLPGSGGDFAA